MVLSLTCAFLGVSDAINQTNHLVSAVAVVRTEVRRLSAERITAHLDADPSLGEAVNKY